MTDASKILFSSDDNGQDKLYEPMFNLNGNSSLIDEPKNNIQKIINEENLTHINNPSEISFDLKDPESNSNSEFISKKTKRSENYNPDKILNELENNKEININIKNSTNLINNNNSSEIISIKTEKSDKKEINKLKINKEAKALLQNNYDCFLDGFTKIKNFRTFLDVPFAFLAVIYKIDSDIEIPNSLVEKTPNEFIEEILIYKKQKEKNKNENIKKEIKEIKISFNLEEIKVVLKFFELILGKKENEITEENDVKEILCEDIIIFFDNRIDNLFDRLKSMTHKTFILIYNSKVSEENILPVQINKYLEKIKGTRDNIQFFENSFISNFLFFGEESKQLTNFLEIKKRLYSDKEKNKEAIALLEKPTLDFLNEILNNEELRTIFFIEDEIMKIKDVIIPKFQKVLNDLSKEEDRKEDLEKLNNFIDSCSEENSRKNNFEEFMKEIKKIKGYEKLNLHLTGKEIEKINERILILENLAENPLLYLNLKNPREPRNKEKKEKMFKGKKFIVFKK